MKSNAIIVIVLLVIGLSLISLVACGRKTETDSSGGSVPSEQSRDFQTNKTETIEVELDEDLSVPGAIYIQHYDIVFSRWQISKIDTVTGKVELSYNASVKLPQTTNLSALPILINFCGELLTVDNVPVSTTSPAMLTLDFSEGSHELGVKYKGGERIYEVTALIASTP